MQLHSSDDPSLWYKDAIIYELHVRAFFDSNDDGIGDFCGLAAKLDYLQGLGVTALWLLPFYPSPLKDGKTLGLGVWGWTIFLTTRRRRSVTRLPARQQVQ